MSDTYSLTEASRQLKDLIQPPPDCYSIAQIAPVATQMLNVMRSMPLPSWGLGELSDQLDSMIELCRIIERGGDEVPSTWQEKKRTSRGAFITQFPVYAALKYLSTPANYSFPRVILSAHIIAAVYAGRPGFTENGDSKPIPDTNVHSACREIRLLPGNLLEQFGKVSYDRDEFYENLETFIQSRPVGIDKKLLDRFHSIRRIIGLAKGIEHPQKKSKEASGSRPFVDVSWREDTSDIDRDDGLCSDSVSNIPSFDESDNENLNEAVNSGLPASDVINTHTIRCVNARYSPRKGVSPEHGLYRHRDVSNRIKRQSQLLPGRWEQLGQLDIEVFLNWVEQTNGTELSALALLISFFTGRPLDVVTKTKLYSKDANLPMTHKGSHILLSFESRTWISQPPMPERKRPMNVGWHQNLVNTAANLVLPIPDLLWDLLIRRVGECPMNWKGNLFTKTEQFSVIRNAKDLLSEGTKRPDVRLTVTRIHRHLFNLLAGGGGDVADAVLITGIMPPYGQASAIYYYNIDCGHIESVYLDALARIPGLQRRAGESMRQVCLRQESVGSPFCPRLDWLPAMVSELKADVHHHRRMQPSDKSLAKIHNSYTLYTLCFLAYATGYRSVKFPISRQSDVDWDSGFLVVADKIGDDMSHSRLIPLTSAVLEHLALYQRHRDTLIRRLWGLGKQKASEHFLFFLKGTNNEIDPVTPLKVKERLGKNGDLPLNINRHFLRSELRARGVPGELVDVFMGHWSNGQEPHGKFSSFSYRDYRDQVVPVMANILSELGWEPLAGIGGGA